MPYCSSFFIRFIASGKHIGKVVIKVRDEEADQVVTPSQKLVPAIPRTYVNPDKSYILVGTCRISVLFLIFPINFTRRSWL